MNPIVDEVKREYGGKVSFEFISMDDKPGKDRAAGLGIIGYPNILVLDSAGNRYSLLKGVVPKETLAATLDGVLAQEAD
jgi:thioredoxin-like negative regulator of GroEL